MYKDYIYEIDYVSFLIKNIKNPTFKKILEVNYYFVRHMYSQSGTLWMNDTLIKTNYTNLPCGKKVLDILENMSFDEILRHNNYERFSQIKIKTLLEMISDYENNKLFTSIKESYKIGDNINLLDVAYDGNAPKYIIDYITEWK